MRVTAKAYNKEAEIRAGEVRVEVVMKRVWRIKLECSYLGAAKNIQYSTANPYAMKRIVEASGQAKVDAAWEEAPEHAHQLLIELVEDVEDYIENGD